MIPKECGLNDKDQLFVALHGWCEMSNCTNCSYGYESFIKMLKKENLYAVASYGKKITKLIRKNEIYLYKDKLK